MGPQLTLEALYGAWPALLPPAVRYWIILTSDGVDHVCRLLGTMLAPAFRVLTALLWWSARELNAREVNARILDPEDDVSTRQRWQLLLDDAIALLQSYDARSHRRFTSHVHRVAVVRTRHPHFVYPWCTCVLPLQRADNTADQIAVVLVHEATHAWLRARGIHHPAAMKHRVERICIRAQISFARRLPGDASALLRHLEGSLSQHSVVL